MTSTLGERDWTVDPNTGRSNSSEAFIEAVELVQRLIRCDTNTARLVVAQLAHGLGLAPHTTSGGVQRCPVCEGRGYVPEGFYPFDDGPPGYARSCRTCGTQGMVR